jgi:sec-independent protein translocase protein TatA
MFGLSGEHILVLLVILLIFGPKRLPDLGHSIGRTLKNFKDAMNGNGMGAHESVPPASLIPSAGNAALRETAPAAAATAAREPVAEKQPEMEKEKV